LLNILWSYLAARLGREEGATMVEYGLMVALIAIVALLAVAAIGTNLFGLFSDVANELE